MPKNNSTTKMTPKSIDTNPWVVVEKPQPKTPKKPAGKLAKGGTSKPKK